MVGSKCRDLKNREVSNVNAPIEGILDFSGDLKTSRSNMLITVLHVNTVEYKNALWPGYLDRYIRYFLTLVSTQFKTKQIDFSGTRANYFLYMYYVFHYTSGHFILGFQCSANMK